MLNRTMPRSLGEGIRGEGKGGERSQRGRRKKSYVAVQQIVEDARKQAAEESQEQEASSPSWHYEKERRVPVKHISLPLSLISLRLLSFLLFSLPHGMYLYNNKVCIVFDVH